MLEITKNQASPAGNEKSRKNFRKLNEKKKRQTPQHESKKDLAKTIKEDVAHVTTPKNENAIATPYLSSVKHVIKQNYALVIAPKSA